MSIDDKCICHEGYTVLSNQDTSKIAMIIESTKAEEIGRASDLLGEDKLQEIKSISSDMSATYLSVCSEKMLFAEQVIDKFHVMQYIYDAVLHVHSRIKKQLTEGLTKGIKKTERTKKYCRNWKFYTVVARGSCNHLINGVKQGKN
jgi:transposase